MQLFKLKDLFGQKQILAVTWLLGAALVVGIASYFAQQAFDRALLDDAYLVASHVRRVTGESGALDLSLSAQEMSTVLFDQSESLYFAVLSPSGALLAGHAGLRPLQLEDSFKPHFDATFTTSTTFPAYASSSLILVMSIVQ